MGTPDKNKYARTRLFETADDAQWKRAEANSGSWSVAAKPVYRAPQGDWVSRDSAIANKIHFIPETFGSDDSADPNDIELPKWMRCIWDPQAGRWVAAALPAPAKLIGVTNSAVSFGDSVQVTIYASATPGQPPTPVTPQRIETAWFDWSEENSPSDIEKGTRVFIFFCREDSRWRIIRFRGGPGISKGTSVADLSSGSVGAFSVTVDGESRLVNAQAIGDIAADARVVIFETPDGSLCAFQPGGSVFCGDLGLSPGTYRATVDGESSAGGSYDITLLDVQSENDVGVAENITLPNVSSWAGGDYAMGAEVLLHVDDQCNHWITNSLPRACDNTLIDGVSYPGRLSPSTDSSSGADMVEVYLEDDALTQSQRDSLGANNIVNAKWWADVCPRREQRVMVHVINCTLYATASLVLRDIPESTDSSSGVSILGIENGCVVTVPTDEGCAE